MTSSIVSLVVICIPIFNIGCVTPRQYANAIIYTVNGDKINICDIRVKNEYTSDEQLMFQAQEQHSQQSIGIPFAGIASVERKNNGSGLIQYTSGAIKKYNNIFINKYIFTGWGEYGPWQINSTLVDRIVFVDETGNPKSVMAKHKVTSMHFADIVSSSDTIVTIAVYPTQASSELEQYLLSKLHTYLVSFKNLRILERERLEANLIEQNFSFNQSCGDSMCLAEVGRLGGAQKTIGWTLNILEGGNFANVNLRLVDVESAQIEAIGDAEERIFKEESRMGHLVQEALNDLLLKKNATRSNDSSSQTSPAGAVENPKRIRWF